MNKIVLLVSIISISLSLNVFAGSRNPICIDLLNQTFEKEGASVTKGPIVVTSETTSHQENRVSGVPVQQAFERAQTLPLGSFLNGPAKDLEPLFTREVHPESNTIRVKGPGDGDVVTIDLEFRSDPQDPGSTIINDRVTKSAAGFINLGHYPLTRPVEAIAESFRESPPRRNSSQDFVHETVPVVKPTEYAMGFIPVKQAPLEGHQRTDQTTTVHEYYRPPVQEYVGRIPYEVAKANAARGAAEDEAALYAYNREQNSIDAIYKKVGVVEDLHLLRQMRRYLSDLPKNVSVPADYFGSLSSNEQDALKQFRENSSQDSIMKLIAEGTEWTYQSSGRSVGWMGGMFFYKFTRTNRKGKIFTSILHENDVKNALMEGRDPDIGIVSLRLMLDLGIDYWMPDQKYWGMYCLDALPMMFNDRVEQMKARTQKF